MVKVSFDPSVFIILVLMIRPNFLASIDMLVVILFRFSIFCNKSNVIGKCKGIEGTEGWSNDDTLQLVFCYLSTSLTASRQKTA